MIVIKHGFNIYTPKLTIRACLILDQLYGYVTKPLEDGIPNLSDQVFILSLCLEQYNLTEDAVFELFDEVDDPIQLMLDLFEEAGLINQDVDEQSVSDESQSLEDNANVTFTQYMDKLLQQCMEIGMSETEFMNSTLKQVTRYAQSYQVREKNKLEQQALMDYTLASMIRIGFASCIAKGVEYPSLAQAYPFINDISNNAEQDNTVGADGMTAEEREIERNRLKMMEWAEAMNKKRKKQEKQTKGE